MVANLNITSSAGLVTVPGAFRATFQPPLVADPSFFDEGPRLPSSKATSSASSSGSIDTTAIDHYTQGIEVTTYARWSAGLVKAWAGEIGHVVRPAVFGQDKYTFPDPAFADVDRFDARAYVAAQGPSSSPLWQPTFTYPVVVGDNDQAENHNDNGVIEPLTIRAAAGFFSTEAPFLAHDVRGGIMAGNEARGHGSDRALTVDYFAPQAAVSPFLDAADARYGAVPTNGSGIDESSTLLPFADSRYVRNVPPPSSEDATLLEAMSLMTGSTGGYVAYNRRSATCGWDYDGTVAVGTDSIAFGGMTH